MFGLYIEVTLSISLTFRISDNLTQLLFEILVLGFSLKEKLKSDFDLALLV